MSYTILVVDDTKFMRKMLTDMLKQFGYEVVGEADNGRQAVQKYRELRPDVVMMDITMPEMDGIDAMREIRKIDPNSIILICSAMSQQDLISDALKAGANGYVMKPFKPNRVNEVIRKNVTPKIQVVKSAPVEQPKQEPEQPEEYAAEQPLSLEKVFEEKVLTEAALPSIEAESSEAEAEVPPLASLELAVSSEAEEEASVEEPVLEAIEAAEEPEAAEPESLEEEEEASDASQQEAMEAELEPTEQPLSHEEDWSLDDLNELTMIMDGLEEDTSGLLTDSDKPEPSSSNKIIPIIRGGTNMKKFISSYMCNWSEDINGKAISYLVVCTEAENRVILEAVDENQEKQTIEVSLEGFKQLMSWMEDKLSAGSKVRDLTIKAEV